jgi:hypothetical protein
MSPVRRLAVLAALLTLVVTLAGCTGDTSSTPSAAPTTQAADRGTALSDLDTSALVVRRAPFCDLVDPDAVARALGEEPTDVSAHRSGQRTRIDDGTGTAVTDVVHEFGCTWSAGGSRAEAWVFVPPVTRDRARTLVDLARKTTGCRVLPGAAAYGDPSLATTCRLDAGIQVGYRGLFGDAWLACTLTTPGGQQEELTDQAGRWCAAVAAGAASAG